MDPEKLGKVNDLMKAVIYEKYGGPEVLELADIKKPTPDDHEIIVRIHATSVGYGDTFARKGLPLNDFNMPLLFWLPAKITFGIRKPKQQVLGSEFSGIVEETGKDVKRFKQGDKVFGYSGPNFGACAEYFCTSEKAGKAKALVEIMPANAKYAEAAAVPYGALTALNILKKTTLAKGDKILIIGASGNIGSAAVQLAKHYGAEVTGICSTGGQEFVKTLGADHVIDYTQEDFTNNDERYDVILDILGRSSFSGCKNSLKEKGRYVSASFKMKKVLQMLWTSMFSSKKVICAMSMEKPEDLTFVKGLFEKEVIKPFIDRQFPFNQVAVAHQHVDSNPKKGSVIIDIQDDKTEDDNPGNHNYA